MKARVISFKGNHKVQIVQGCQSFRLDYSGKREECRWMANMFNLAVRAHNQEFLDKLLPRARAARAREREKLQSV